MAKMKSTRYVSNADSPIRKIYELCRQVTDLTIAETKKHQGNDSPIQLDIPIILGDDMIITIQRGPETMTNIAILKAPSKP